MRGPRLARLRPRFTSVHVLALVALFLALSSGAMAATKYLTANDQITQGDLAGSTYGNPVIAAGKVTTGKIADGAITSSKLDSSATAPNAAKLRGFDVTTVSQTFTVVTEFGLIETLSCPFDRIAVHYSVTNQGPDMHVDPIPSADTDQDTDANGYTRGSFTFDVRNSTFPVTPESATVNLFCLGSEDFSMAP